MSNQLVCMEGTLSFEEEFRAQTINLITFRSGQQITINRDPIPKDKSLLEHIKQQVKDTEKVFNQVQVDRITVLDEQTSFLQVVEIVFSFLTPQNKRVWQVTFACQNSPMDVINFTCLYPDQASRANEEGRLKHCALHFVTHSC